jgi:hypothetical protein
MTKPVLLRARSMLSTTPAAMLILTPPTMNNTPTTIASMVFFRSSGLLTSPQLISFTNKEGLQLA